MIFQKVKQMFENCWYAEIDGAIYQELLDEIYISLRAYHAGEMYEDAFPQEYIDLREWVYTRVAKDIIYQNTGYLNDHFCIGTVYGMLRVCDDQSDNGSVWYDIYNKILKGE